ncbi:hypothetical protein ACIHCV_15215 [Streptomyces sp. NPDC051956]|uniref:hypothetical protein n=1 Tax=Streptomyces sp. NPDC051956 TaxID=3365677 RepID=UPI0037D62A51
MEAGSGAHNLRDVVGVHRLEAALVEGAGAICSGRAVPLLDGCGGRRHRLLLEASGAVAAENQVLRLFADLAGLPANAAAAS